MSSSKNFFDDVFNIHGDDDDIHEDETVDFDDFAIGMESKSEIQVLHTNQDDESIVVEEQHLSQRLSQLSASPVTKKFKADTRTTDEHMPKYLRANHRLFDETMQPLLQREATSINIEDSREIAHLIHGINLTNLLISQWQIYLRSGTGDIRVSFPESKRQMNPSIWPSEVKKMMLREGTVNAVTESDIDSSQCLSFTQNYLANLRTSVEKRQKELNDRKRRLTQFTTEMSQAIDLYVFQHFMDEASLRIQKNMLIIEYNYRDHLLELEFEQLNPTEDQLHLYRELNRIKVEYEKSKMNVDILKQHVFYKVFPVAFDSFRVPLPSQMDFIADTSLRETFHNRYERIIQQTKSDMMSIHIAVAEAKMRQCRHDLKSQDDLYNNQGWTNEMISLKQRRFKDYEERILRIYNLKMNFFVKAPTVSGKML